MKDKRVQLRISNRDLQKIDRKADKAKLTRTDFLIKSALDKPIVHLECGKEIARQLCKNGSNINQLTALSHMGKIQIVYLDEYQKEVSQLWQLLSSSISQTAPTRK